MSLVDLVLLLFGAKTLIFALGAARSRKIGSTSYPNNPLKISVIIPARNEEEQLSMCLDSLIEQVEKNVEFIIVDDRSSDGTGEIIDRYSSMDKRVKGIQLTEERTGNLRGKPGALHAGILASTGDIIMMSDADCTFPAHWIHTVRNAYHDPAIGMIAGFTTIKATTIFHHLQDMEWMMNHTLASAGMALGQPLGCFGNNLSLRREVYDAIGGYERIPFSVTEDLLLLQTVAQSGKTILYPISDSNAVSTMPCKDWNAFVSQQHRWVRGSEALGWKKYLFVFFAFLFWGGLLLSGINGDYYGVISILGIRIIGDCVIVFPTLQSLKRLKQLPWLIPGMIFMMFIEIMVALLLFKKEVEWKGQAFR